ncbi:MAG TPA: alpha/beta hydrolase [Paracoccaceae bacterium]|nr:alpha/beta hydrolase [Paracoccaceae bacterium]
MGEAWSGPLRLETEAFGPEGGVPVLLVMGATASMLGWPEAFCHGLAEAGCRTVRFDHRDTGRSSRSGRGYAAEDMASDVLAVMDAQGWDRAHLVGMSLGGYLAQMAAVDDPGRVVSLTLIASEPLGWDGPPLPGISPAFLDHFAGFGALDWADDAAVGAFLLEIERLCAGSHAPFDAPAARARVAAVMARSGDVASAFVHGSIATLQDWSRAYRRIACPVLVIHGTEDPILPVGNGRALAAGIAGARILELAGRGHELHAGDLPALVGAIAQHVGAGA